MARPRQWIERVARRGRALAVLLALLSMARPAAADGWSLIASPSGSGQAASTANAEGDRLYVWAKHLKDRSLVFAEVHLENEEFAGRMPVYRIDDGETVDAELIRREGEKQGSLWGFVAGRACFWLIWASDRATVDDKDHLARWMTGKRLALTFQAADGAQKETDFSLDGSRGPIERATDLKMP